MKGIGETDRAHSKQTVVIVSLLVLVGRIDDAEVDSEDDGKDCNDKDEDTKADPTLAAS